MTLTYERVRELFYYDPETGEFRWKVSNTNSVKVGAIAGGFDRHGHRRIKADGRFYGAHRLAWLYQTGRWPVALIDHINMVPDDNRFCNLREATKSQNGCNSGKRSDNTTGVKGVCWDKQMRKYRVGIMVGGKRFQTLCKTLEEAKAIHREKIVEIHGAFARCE